MAEPPPLLQKHDRVRFIQGRVIYRVIHVTAWTQRLNKEPIITYLLESENTGKHHSITSFVGSHHLDLVERP